MTPTIESETAETYRALNVAESHAGLLERRLDRKFFVSVSCRHRAVTILVRPSSRGT